MLRTLFDVPSDPGYMPPMIVGMPSPAEPDDHKMFCRFPIDIEGDIPLLIVNGYMLAGVPEPPERHVKYFASTESSAPTAGPVSEPFKLLDKSSKPGRWNFEVKDLFDGEQRWRHLLGNQLLRLVDTVYRKEVEKFDDNLFPCVCDGAEAKRAEKIIADEFELENPLGHQERHVHVPGWDHLAESRTEFYRRETWKPKVANLGVELIVERVTPR